MTDCGFPWGYHREHRCCLNDEHTQVYADSSNSEKNAVTVHVCYCGEAWQEKANLG